MFADPRVILVSKTQSVVAGVEELMRYLDSDGWSSDGPEGSGQDVPEVAGRLCYLSFGSPRPATEGKSRNTTYLRHILESGHGSVLEHLAWGLVFTGVSRSWSHEMVRHRAGFGFSQVSQRYVDSSQVRFVVPPALKHCSQEVMSDFTRSCIAAKDAYTRLADAAYLKSVQRLADKVGHAVSTLDEAETWVNMRRAIDPELSTRLRKESRQAARSVLPNCTETMLYVTGNCRAWRHFIEMRCSRHADTEMRIVAGTVLKTLYDQAPDLFGDYERQQLADGTFEVRTPWRKV